MSEYNTHQEGGDPTIKLEQEGLSADLLSYIDAHKEMVLPRENVTSEEAKNNERLAWVVNSKSYMKGREMCVELTIRYIDRDGAIWDVIIDTDKIDSIKKEEISTPDASTTKAYEQSREVINALKNLGFKFDKENADDPSNASDIFDEKILEYRERIRKEKEN